MSGRQGNCDLKVAILQKDIETLTKENVRLSKENTRLSCELASESTATADFKEKVHKLRCDIEQQLKSRHQQWHAEKVELVQRIADCESAHSKHIAIITEKESQISALQHQLLVSETARNKAIDAAYEAKRTQVAVVTDDFTTVGCKQPSK